MTQQPDMRLVPVEPTSFDKLETVYDWLREPDYGDTFNNKDLVEWLNRRPSGLLMQAIGEMRKAERAVAPAPSAVGGGDVLTLRTLLDNLVIAQSLSKAIRDTAAIEARSYLRNTRAALTASPQPEQAGGSSAEERAEQFIRAAIDSAPEPLQKLGEFLTTVLNEDHWPTAERYLLALATTPPRSGVNFLLTEDGEFNGNEWEGDLTPEEQSMIDAAWETHKAAHPTASTQGQSGGE